MCGFKRSCYTYFMKKSYSGNNSGFTIVELLVVIVVIGILAAITIVSYSGISQRAIAASLQSDLASAQKQLLIYQTENDAYPTEVDDCPNPAVGNLCINQSSSDNSFDNYSVNNSVSPPTFSLDAINNTTVYRVTNDSAPVAVVIDPNWISGVAATAMAGKYVRNADSGMDSYGSYVANASPQAAVGLDPNYPSNMVLVSPQEYPAVDFSQYHAQNICKAISGRLPNTQELVSIYQNRALYGDNFASGGIYWASTEHDTLYAKAVYFDDGSVIFVGKPNSIYIRCVAD
jgi:general secretion pathway protein G